MLAALMEMERPPAQDGIDTTHRPVMVREILSWLGPCLAGPVLDCTVGGGGHAEAILDADPRATVLGLDRDPVAVTAASRRLARFGRRAIVRRVNYARLGEAMRSEGITAVGAVLMDLGTSAFQLRDPRRGFSFQSDGPIDMRMGPDAPITAEEFLSRTSEHELARIIEEYGEERHAGRIARRISEGMKRGEIRTTAELARAIGSAVPRAGRERIDPATRTFQAIRIAVNAELDLLKEALPEAAKALRQGGRLAVISFHSLEDRIVKEFMNTEAKDCVCPPEWPACTCSHRRTLSVLTRKPATASPAETSTNPSARSAKLRLAERL